MYLAIDNRRMIRQPHTIEVVPYEHAVGQTGDGRVAVQAPTTHQVALNCTFGTNLSYQDVMGELDRLRANRGVHSITFEPRDGCEYLTINAYMGVPRVTHVGYDSKGKIVDSAFTVPFVQVDTPTFLYPMRFHLDDIIAAISPFTFHNAPAAGRIIAIDGCIRDLGAGGGQTRVQMHNDDSAIDYLAAPGGDFICAAPPVYTLQNAVLGGNLDFAEDDRIDCDVTQIPPGGMSRDALVTLWCWIYQP